MKKRGLSFRAWLCVCLLVLTTGCALNPVTGKRELSLISESGEISLGQQTDKEVRTQYGAYDDPAVEKYITGVGMRLVPHTHRLNLPYAFAVLDTPVVNAFAAPGGFIYVTRGVLALMNSEAELSAVLGHELGHVNARHSVRKMSQMILVQIGLAVGSALSETFDKISGLASVGIQLLFLKFSRDDEREADALGVEYARKGGYNPAEMISFFSALEKLGDLSEGYSLPGFLSTHPLTPERIKDTSEMILSDDRQLKVNKTAYLNILSGMVYGNDPRQGYVEGNVFYYPGLRFSFSFPRDWKVQNTPSQIVLISKDEKAAVILQIEKTSESLQDYAQKKASALEGRQFISEHSLTVNGMDSFQQLYELTQQSGENLKIRMSFIRKDSWIYTFSALSKSSDFSSYDFQFGTLVGSFNELRDSRYLNRQPKRIRLIKATGRDSLEKIFQTAGMDKDLYTKFAIMNGMSLSETPERNQLIKIVK